jgi:glycosyltransferase involved in cell wall biosynthesis
MKLIYLHQYFTTPAMAGGTRSYEMARRLVAKGHEVHIVTSWRDATPHRDWFETMVDGIHVHWLPVPYSNHMGFADRVRAFLRFALKAGPRAASLGGDVVFATSTPLTIAIPGAWTSWRLKAPMVFEVRDAWPAIPIAMGVLRNPLLVTAARWLERFAYRRSRHVVALSDGMADDVVATGYPRSQVTVIPNSSDLEMFSYSASGALRFRQNHPELGDGPIVLYPGTLGKANGVSYLPALAEKMLALRHDVRFVVIGAGAEAAQVQAEAHRLGVAGLNFFQYEAMPKAQLVDAFSASAVLISLFIDNPVLWANSANKFFDGLAAGKAIAINYQGWQAALLQETGAGIVRPPQADAVAAQALLSLLEDEIRLLKAGQAARHLAETRYSRDLLADRLESVLRDAAR